MELLNKGLNYVPTPTHLPLLDIVTDIETALQFENSATKNIIRKQAKPLILNAKINNYHPNQKQITEQKVLRSLKQKPVYYVKADKGNAVVILDKSDYDERVSSSIEDGPYELITKNPLPKMVRDATEMISKINKTFNNKFKYGLNVSNPCVPKAYGLPKIHKTGNKMRLITSNINAPTYNLARWLLKEIETLQKFPTLGIKNSLQLSELLQQQRLSSEDILVSFDVEALFPSIPINEAIDAFDYWLNSTNIEAEKISRYLEVAKLCMNHTFFQFRGNYYKQIFGTSMGNPLSPLIAEIFMSKMEMSLLSQNLLPRFWTRYVDDILVIIDKNTVDNTLSTLNNQHPTIKFTIERENNFCIPFLDLLLTRKDDRIDISVYHKPTNTNRLMTSDSHCSFKIKMSAFHSMSHRLYKLPLSIKNYMKEYEHIKTLALLNGYNTSIVDEIVKHHAKKINRSSLSTLYSQHNILSQKTMRRVRFTYAPTITNKLKDSFGKNNISLCFGNKIKIQQILGNTKDKPPEMEQSGIYQYTCSSCDKVYVGQTKRNLKIRFNEHLSHIKYNRPHKSSIAKHALTENHTNIQIIELEPELKITNGKFMDETFLDR